MLNVKTNNMYIWGVTKKYKSLNWFENFMSGHVNIGRHITIYGANAMNWAVNIYTKRWGYVCFTLPAFARFRKYHNSGKKYFEWYFYCSPNGTPWAATFYRGSNKDECIRAERRHARFGHNFNVIDQRVYSELRKLNDFLC